MIFKLKHWIQVFLLNVSYSFFNLVVSKNTTMKWVIGVDEIASTIFFTGKILKPSYTVSLSQNIFYNLHYDFEYKKYFFIPRTILAPILLAYLTNQSTHFFYIWHTGFLLNRDYEFKFLKSKGKKLICLFVGDDIRSLKLTMDYANKLRIDTYANYYKSQNPFFFTESYDNQKKAIAASADQYADFIFNAKMDQMSYLQSPQHGWSYIYDTDKFYKNDAKFTEKIQILHAPSNPVYKGTQLIRAAIKKLEIEGYNFNYLELQDKSNVEVLEQLKLTHIVLNSFYSFAPGLFGIEAMAHQCAVLMSADPTIETTLPQEFNDAWLITQYWEIYDKLKYLLDNPEQIKYYADNGYNFALKHYTYEAAGEYIQNVLKENGIIE